MIKLNKDQTKIAYTAMIALVTMLFLSISAGFYKPLSIALSHVNFYMFLRLGICCTMTFAAYVAKSRRLNIHVYIFSAVAVIFNPFMPLHAGQPVWMVLDLLTIGTYWMAYKKLL